MTYAPEIITKYSDGLTSSTIIRILNEYFKYAGARGVIAGQVIDIESEKNPNIKNKEETLNYIHIHKTSDLFQLAMRTGAIIADASDEQLQAVSEFAKKFGLAFQICDDILDEISTFEELGKTIGKDTEENKLTYTSLYGLDEAKCKLVCVLDECYDIMYKHSLKSDIINEIIEQLRKRAGV